MPPQSNKASISAYRLSRKTHQSLAVGVRKIRGLSTGLPTPRGKSGFASARFGLGADFLLGFFPRDQGFFTRIKASDPLFQDLLVPIRHDWLA
jgi:hypothetical protein